MTASEPGEGPAGRFTREAVAPAAESDAVRRQIADELHDCALQLLLAAHADLRDPPSDPEALEATRAMLDDAIAEIRRIMSGAPPASVLSRGGLAFVLQSLCARATARTGVVATSRVEPGAAGGPYDDLLFALAREFVENTIKHASAGHLDVTVRVHAPYVELSVTDDGCGMPARTRRRGRTRGENVGLPLAERRVRGAGGFLTVDVHPGGGTTMTVLLPGHDWALVPR